MGAVGFLAALSAADTQLEYQPRSAPSLWTLACDVLKSLPDARVAELAGLDRGTVADARKGKRLRKSTRAAAELANEWIREQRIRPIPVRRESRLALYLELRDGGCRVCGKPIRSAHATYCSDACRQKAHRACSAAAWLRAIPFRRPPLRDVRERMARRRVGDVRVVPARAESPCRRGEG